MSGLPAIAPSILTRYLRAGLERIDTGTDLSGFAVIETAHIPSFPHHSIHPEVGVSVRDRGVVTVQSPVRFDEVESPTVWVRTSGPTAELLARATLSPYFGFRPKAWTDDPAAGAEIVVCDEEAALAPLEGGFREGLCRAWFVLTGLPLVTHLLAVPANATAAGVEVVAAWFASGGGLSKDERRAIREEIVLETGASLDDVAALMTGVRWTMAIDERRSIAELFSRSGVSAQIGAINWYNAAT